MDRWIEWTRVAGSTCVSAIGIERSFDGEVPHPTRIHVRFRRGRTYVYEVGDPRYGEKFLDAASKGRFYVFVIKARFDYVWKY